MSHIRGIILEGYSHAGKTSVLKALKLLHAQDESSERSIIVLSEHYSQLLNNVHGEFKCLSRDEHLHVLKERVDMLKQLNGWATYLGPDASRGSRGIFFILERFHLNHRAAFPSDSLYEIENIEKELLLLGAKCVLLTVSPENIEQRMQNRTPHEWKNKTKNEIKKSADEFLHTQSELRKQSSLSILPTIEVNTDNKDWAAYAKEIMDLIN
jgi:thymidylate kinase